MYLRSLSPGVRLPPAAAGEVALRRYLAAVARHAVADVARALRAAKRSGRVESLDRSDWSHHDAGVDLLRRTATGPATALLRSEEAIRLEQAFRALSPEHRRVLGLRQLEGLSAAEAARRMGRSETAIHSLYRRALESWHDAARPS